MRTIINAKVLMLGILLVIPLLAIAADDKIEKLQEINTEVNMRNNNLYQKNTDINIQNREDNVFDKCVEVRNKIRRKVGEIDFAIRTRSADYEQRLKQELQDLQVQELQYCQ